MGDHTAKYQLYFSFACYDCRNILFTVNIAILLEHFELGKCAVNFVIVNKFNFNNNKCEIP